jgi:hypothetical protein
MIGIVVFLLNVHMFLGFGFITGFMLLFVIGKILPLVIGSQRGISSAERV